MKTIFLISIADPGHAAMRMEIKTSRMTTRSKAHDMFETLCNLFRFLPAESYLIPIQIHLETFQTPDLNEWPFGKAGADFRHLMHN